MTKPTTVAVCLECWEQGEGFWLPVEEAGDGCPSEGHERSGRLTKRRLYICDIPNHCDENGYLTAAGLAEHQEDSL